MRYITLLLITSLSCALQSGHPNSLTLPHAQAMSTTRPALEAQQYAISASKHSERQEMSRYLPQITATESSLFSKELNVNNSAHSISLRGSQLIFDASGPQLQTRIAALSTQKTTYQFHTTSHEIRHTVAIQFLKTWLLKQKDAYITQLANYITCLEERNNAEQAQQTINHITWAATAATIAQHQSTIHAHTLAYESARMALAQALGYGNSTAVPDLLHFNSDTPFPQLKTVDEYIALAYAHRPELKEKNATTEQYTLIAQSHRNSYLPTLSAHGSVSTTFAGSQLQQGTSAHIGFTLQWNLFDGLQRAHAAHQADAQKMRTHLERQELKNTIALMITTTYNTLIASTHTLAALEAQAALEQSKDQEAYIKYTHGSLDPVDYAKQKLASAAANYEICAQKITLHMHWQTLAWHCGYPTTGVLDEQ